MHVDPTEPPRLVRDLCRDFARREARPRAADPDIRKLHRQCYPRKDLP